MQAVVLAGGYATRLWPITRHRPKMLLPVGETTVIDRVLDDLEADDRIDDVYLSTNERFAEEFERHLADSDFEKPQLSIEDTTHEDEKFGVMGALAQLVDREGIDGEDLLVIAGDNLISFDVSDFLDDFQRRGTPLLAAYDVGTREKAKSYGLVTLDGDRIVDFQEKPEDPNSTLVSIACYAFPADAVRFQEYLDEDNNPDEPGWFIQWLVEREEVHAFTFEEAWYDIGTPESYLEAVAWHLDGRTLVDETATVENCDLGDDVHVMADAELHDSTVDHSVVFPDATVAGCEIRDSIIDRETHVENLDLAGALIGAHTHISNGFD
ncbi:MAG: sugar phosphate nucleotidyltransferase [Haloarculaceae archaeon]